MFLVSGICSSYMTVSISYLYGPTIVSLLSLVNYYSKIISNSSSVLPKSALKA